MDNLSIELTPGMLALVPIVGALLQMLKKISYVERFKEWLPLVSMLISFGFLYYQNISDPLLPAVIIGLTACGGFDLMKSKKNSK